jgi:uncharacterized protein
VGHDFEGDKLRDHGGGSLPSVEGAAKNRVAQTFASQKVCGLCQPRTAEFENHELCATQLKSFDTVISPALLDELDEKLRGKFEVSAEDASAIRARIASIAHRAEPKEALHVIREDPDDDLALECAVAGRADTIVSGDRHLLTLASFRGISIMRVRQYLALIEPKQDSM